MRRGKRIQPYIPRDLFEKLHAYTAEREETVRFISLRGG